MAERVGLTHIALGRCSALRARSLRSPSKTLARFVERWLRIYNPLRQTQKKALADLFSYLAERVGFEPTVRYNRTPDFESGPFDHSGTSPIRFVPGVPGVVLQPGAGRPYCTQILGHWYFPGCSVEDRCRAVCQRRNFLSGRSDRCEWFRRPV